VIRSLIENLQKDIALLQLYVNQRQKADFHDMEKYIEVIALHMFNAAGIGKFTEKN
jgi:hypothetical protein